MSKNHLIEEFENAIKSEKGKAFMKAYAEKLVANRERLEARLQRFHAKYKDNLNEVVEKLMAKYYSDAYVIKEHRLGYEPRETLLWFLFEYAKRYCNPCEDERYFNIFTGEAFYVGKYVLQIMYGQGAALRIDDVKTDEEIGVL